MKPVTALCMGSLLIACLAGCQKQEERSPGPAEQVGRKLDEAAAQIGPEINKLGQKAGEAMQEAGQQIQKKAQEARNEQADKKPSPNEPPASDQDKQNKQ